MDRELPGDRERELVQAGRPPRSETVAKTVVVAASLSLVSLLAGAAVLLLAEFGASAWILAGPLTWLVTLGLPTLVSVLLLARLWPGPSFPAFLLSALLLSFLFQFAALAAIRQARARRRRRLAR